MIDMSSLPNLEKALKKFSGYTPRFEVVISNVGTFNYEIMSIPQIKQKLEERYGITHIDTIKMKIPYDIISDLSILVNEIITFYFYFNEFPTEKVKLFVGKVKDEPIIQGKYTTVKGFISFQEILTKKNTARNISNLKSAAVIKQLLNDAGITDTYIDTDNFIWADRRTNYLLNWNIAANIDSYANLIEEILEICMWQLIYSNGKYKIIPYQPQLYEKTISEDPIQDEGLIEKIDEINKYSTDVEKGIKNDISINFDWDGSNYNATHSEADSASITKWGDLELIINSRFLKNGCINERELNWNAEKLLNELKDTQEYIKITISLSVIPYEPGDFLYIKSSIYDINKKYRLFSKGTNPNNRIKLILRKTSISTGKYYMLTNEADLSSSWNTANTYQILFGYLAGITGKMSDGTTNGYLAYPQDRI